MDAKSTGRPKYFYPEFKLEVQYFATHAVYVIFTFIRVRSSWTGKWYYVRIFETSKMKSAGDGDSIFWMLQRFHKKIYTMQLMPNPSTDVIDQHGNRIFILDPVQETESERMAKLLQK